MFIRNFLAFFPFMITFCLAIDHDTDLDFAIALSLNEAEKRLTIETDAAIAQSLQEAETTAMTPDKVLALKLSSLSLNQRQIYIEAQQVIHPLMQQYKQCFDKNVHSFNKLMNWPTTINQLFTFCDRLYPEYVCQLPSEIFNLIRKTQPYQGLNEKSKQEFNKNIDLLTKHLQSSMIEGSETKVSLDHLLSRIWMVSMHYGDDHHRLVSLLVPVIIDNIATSGGCYPGFAGRLCGVFLILMNDSTKLTNED